jgi:hypothetical protein
MNETESNRNKPFGIGRRNDVAGIMCKENEQKNKNDCNNSFHYTGSWLPATIRW